MADRDQATAPGAKEAPKVAGAPAPETSVPTASPAAAEAPKEAAEPVVEEAPKVKLRSKNVEEYPVSVSVVGAEEELVFESESTTIEVAPEVAEQIAYSPVVEVVE